MDGSELNCSLDIVLISDSNQFVFNKNGSIAIGNRPNDFIIPEHSSLWFVSVPSTGAEPQATIFTENESSEDVQLMVRAPRGKYWTYPDTAVTVIPDYIETQDGYSLNTHSYFITARASPQCPWNSFVLHSAPMIKASLNEEGLSVSSSTPGVQLLVSPPASLLQFICLALVLIATIWASALYIIYTRVNRRRRVEGNVAPCAECSKNTRIMGHTELHHEATFTCFKFDQRNVLLTDAVNLCTWCKNEYEYKHRMVPRSQFDSLDADMLCCRRMICDHCCQQSVRISCCRTQFTGTGCPEIYLCQKCLDTIYDCPGAAYVNSCDECGDFAGVIICRTCGKTLCTRCDMVRHAGKKFGPHFRELVCLPEVIPVATQRPLPSVSQLTA